MKKEVIINGQYEYDLTIDDNIYKLSYSNAEHWHFKGEVVLELHNTGNGYEIITPLRKKNQIDYQEAEMLYILLAAVKESKIEVVENKREI